MKNKYKLLHKSKADSFKIRKYLSKLREDMDYMTKHYESKDKNILPSYNCKDSKDTLRKFERVCN